MTTRPIVTVHVPVPVELVVAIANAVSRSFPDEKTIVVDANRGPDFVICFSEDPR